MRRVGLVLGLCASALAGSTALSRIAWASPRDPASLTCEANQTFVGKPTNVCSGAEAAGPLPLLPVFVQAWPGVGTTTLDTRGLDLASAGSDAVFHIGGRLHEDVGAASLDPRQPFAPLSADAAVRRAWFEVGLKLHDVTLAFQYDLASANRPIDDAYVAYRPFTGFNVVAGNFKEPFSLNQLESNNTTLFVERSLLDALSPQRDVGLGLGGNGERWTLMGGVFGGTPVTTGIGRFGIAGTARLTYAPLMDAVQVLHVGVAGSYRALDRGGTALAFNDKPEDFLFARSLVATGSIADADAVGRLGLEAAYQYGSVHLQGEYALTRVSGAGAADRSFEAAYVEAGWVLNGAGRSYRLAASAASEYAVFGGVPVPEERHVSRGGTGVFELGARLSAIDLRSGPVKGGAEVDGSLGLNWYPDLNLRLMADYIHAHADPTAAALPARTLDSDQFIGRLQVAW